MEGESDLCSDSSDNDIDSLKEALLVQHQVLQKLYMELDKEREASSTAANEALSMILRLQGEKAAEKMEAHQYKRMAEEKIKHAQESIEVIEELMYRKEKEMSSLRFQVQAYRHKLLSLGFEGIEIDKIELLGNPYCCRDDDQITMSEAYDKSTRTLCPEDMGYHRRVRRNISLPVMKFKNSCLEKGILQVDEPSFTLGKLAQRNLDKDLEQEYMIYQKTAQTGMENHLGKKRNIEKLSTVEENALDMFDTEDSNSYWDRTEQMDEQVKELPHENILSEGFDSEWVSKNKELHPKATSRSCSSYSAMSSEPVYDSTRVCTGNRTEIGRKFSCSSSQAEDSDYLSEFDTFNPYFGREKSGETIHTISFHDIFEVPQDPRDYKECESSKQMPDPMLEETEDPDFTKDPEWIKKALIYAFHENKMLKVANLNQKFNNPCQSEVQQLKKRLELLENDRMIIKQEGSRGKEELQLLREISKRLNTIETQIRNPQTKERNHPEEASLVSIMEAMLSFSL